MSGVEAHLKTDERVFLLHNADDFIVKPEDLNHLQSVFGARMRLYPHGGHMGNLWFPENLGTIFEIFSALER
jgi:hypothetical protein